LEIHKYIYFKALKEVSALPLVFILLMFKEKIKFLQILRDGKCCDLYSAFITLNGAGARGTHTGKFHTVLKKKGLSTIIF
jgi:hypothetical protein